MLINMKINHTILCFLLLASGQLNAQSSHVLVAGRIEYEKKLNLYAQFNDDDAWAAEFKRRIPQFKTSYFELSFTDAKTLYKPGRDNEDNNKLWQEPSEDNIIYTDLEHKYAVSQKNVFEKTFLVEDSTRKIHWKITEEKRTIAGFECRRANAVIMDSIYIVAFYTDDIAAPGGPESFNGLPGMILGLAIPHEHVTWFATKLYPATDAKESDFKIPAKGTKTTNAGLQQTLKSSLKSWGRYADRYIKAAML